MTTKSKPGNWQNLAAADQVPRYEAVAGMLRHFALCGSVLDVGAGTGILRGYLKPHTDYVGIEPCLEAADKSPANVEHARAEDWNPNGRKFNAVVFNETIYYFADPVGIVSKYAAFLRPGGAVLISVYQRPGWPGLKRIFARLADRRRPVSNKHAERMVRAWQHSRGWQTLVDWNIEPWHLWLARP